MFPLKPQPRRAEGHPVTITVPPESGADLDLCGDWELLYADGSAVCLGDIVVSRSQQSYVVTGGRTPHSRASSGRVYVVPNDLDAIPGAYYPTVFDMKWKKKG